MRKTIFFILVLPFLSYSQNNEDAGLWTTLSFQKELSKNTFISYDQEFRLKENFSRLNLFYSNLGFGYKFNKSFKAEISYRGIQKLMLDNSFSYRHRFMSDLTHKIKYNRIIISNRIRYQAEVRDYLTSDDGKFPEQYLRFKSELKIDLDKKMTPYFSSELRYQIHVPKGKNAYFDNTIHRIRNIVGIDFKINDTNTFGLYYLIQNEFNISNPENNYIVGVQYGLKL